MTRPDLSLLAKWLSPDLVADLDKLRRRKKELCRNRKLGTLQTLWLMLAVSLDTGRSGLHEILRLATGELKIGWSVSVPGFCKARKRFSPGGPFVVFWAVGLKNSKVLPAGAKEVAWIAPDRRGQNYVGLTGISISLEALRRT